MGRCLGTELFAHIESIHHYKNFQMSVSFNPSQTFQIKEAPVRVEFGSDVTAMYADMYYSVFKMHIYMGQCTATTSLATPRCFVIASLQLVTKLPKWNSVTAIHPIYRGPVGAQ